MTFFDFINDDSVRCKVELLQKYNGNTESGTAILEAIDLALTIKQTLANGGRVVLLTPDSETQELTLEQEA